MQSTLSRLDHSLVWTLVLCLSWYHRKAREKTLYILEVCALDTFLFKFSVQYIERRLYVSQAMHRVLGEVVILISHHTGYKCLCLERANHTLSVLVYLLWCILSFISLKQMYFHDCCWFTIALLFFSISHFSVVVGEQPDRNVLSLDKTRQKIKQWMSKKIKNHVDNSKFSQKSLFFSTIETVKCLNGIALSNVNGVVTLCIDFLKFNQNQFPLIADTIYSFQFEIRLGLELKNLSFDSSNVSLLNRFFLANQTNICSLTINSCDFHANLVNYSFEQFSNLTKIELIDFKYLAEELKLLLRTLSSSIQTLRVKCNNYEAIWTSDLFTSVFYRLTNLQELYLENFDIRDFTCIPKLLELKKLAVVHLYGEFGVKVAEELRKVKNSLKIQSNLNNWPMWSSFSLKLNGSFSFLSDDLFSTPMLKLIDFSECYFEAEEIVKYLENNINNFGSLERVIFPKGDERNAIVITFALATSKIRIESTDELLVLIQNNDGTFVKVPYHQ